MKFSKPALTIDQQLELLKHRGLQVSDYSKAAHFLTYVSYYRLSAYMRPLQQSGDAEHNFHQDTTFEDIQELYLFDRDLRMLVFDAIERIEIAIRTLIIYNFSTAYGSDWFENSTLFKHMEIHGVILQKLDDELSRSNEVFIKRYLGKYTNPQRPPAWMSLEVFSLGLLSKLFSDLRQSDERKAIAKHFGVDSSILESWLESITFVRNICAHHGRLWNRGLTITPMHPKRHAFPYLENREFENTRLYGILSVILYMLKVVSPETSLSANLKTIIQKYPQMNASRIGFPSGWENERLWS
ncbi:Abi family protein [Spirosoma sp.]|uniref:Abi family protein n=1 Tax=Spirosoma sp. TaxID=1899569 RepID=UPI0026161AF1|nr:Abi family protein [Spirosoma sp.]MCX6214662.1 Abi family protein [Spirosoma sp.]